MELTQDLLDILNEEERPVEEEEEPYDEGDGEFVQVVRSFFHKINIGHLINQLFETVALRATSMLTTRTPHKKVAAWPFRKDDQIGA